MEDSKNRLQAVKEIRILNAETGITIELAQVARVCAARRFERGEIMVSAAPVALDTCLAGSEDAEIGFRVLHANGGALAQYARPPGRTRS